MLCKLQSEKPGTRVLCAEIEKDNIQSIKRKMEKTPKADLKESIFIECIVLMTYLKEPITHPRGERHLQGQTEIIEKC